MEFMIRFRVGLGKVRCWLVRHWRRLVLIGGVSVALILVTIQLIYPMDNLPLFMKLDGIEVGGQSREQAIRQLDEEHQKQKVKLIIGEQTRQIDEPTLSKIGVVIINSERVEQIRYPWYWRLVPTSLFWIHALADGGQPKYEVDDAKVEGYVEEKFGKDCLVPAVEPTAVASEAEIKITNGQAGGKCSFDEVVSQISRLRPVLGEPMKVAIDAESIAPMANVAELKQLVAKIEERLQAGGVGVTANDEVIELESGKVRGWLRFIVNEGKFRAEIDSDKSSPVLEELFGQKLARPAGVTKVTTHDFAETSRQDGTTGQELDVRATEDSIVAYLAGDSDSARAVGRELMPRIEYTRTYSSTDAGLSALIKNYATSKSGSFGVSLIELSGERRRAGFDETKKFTTASTYKVYVAYATLKRVESGDFRWSDQISAGRDLATCFDDMIVKSDNACAEALVKKIGYTPLHREVGSLGLTGTSFIDKESYKTTAGDLSTFMAMLESGTLPVSSESRERLLGALKRNIYRQGIPAGANGAVADKVGFLDGLLHDTAVVHSSNGTYVLTILTNGSSWAEIAELTRQIEGLLK